MVSILILIYQINSERKSQATIINFFSELEKKDKTIEEIRAKIEQLRKQKKLKKVVVRIKETMKTKEIPIEKILSKN